MMSCSGGLPARLPVCPGPLVWFTVPGDGVFVEGGLLECGACGYVVASGNLHDDRHRSTPVLHEGLAT